MTQGRRAAIRFGLSLWLVVLCLPGPAWAGPPQRVMSLNLCADVLLLHLADRSQIASLTFLAASSPLSPVHDLARGLPQNHGTAEEVVAVNPDLVLVHRYSATALVQALEALGFRLLRIEAPGSLESAAAQLAELGAALGHTARGERLARQLRHLPRSAGHAPPPVVAVYGPNGMTTTPGSLLHDLMVRAGLGNFAALHALPATGRIPLEQLLNEPPQALIFSGDAQVDANTLAQQSLQHPALRQLAGRLPTTQVPGQLWSCGGPETAEAMERLLALQRQLASGGSGHAE